MDWKKRLQEAHERFQQATRERDALDREIFGLREIIEGLKSFGGVDEPKLPPLKSMHKRRGESK